MLSLPCLSSSPSDGDPGGRPNPRVRYEFPARGSRPPVKVTWTDGRLLPPIPEDLEPGRHLPGKRQRPVVTFPRHDDAAKRIIRKRRGRKALQRMQGTGMGTTVTYDGKDG